MKREKWVSLPVNRLTLPAKSREDRGELVSLSLATAAENGKYANICCDGRLVFGDVAADVSAPKFQWFGDWILMFAGQLASTDLIVEQLRLESLTPEATRSFARENVAKTLRLAFNDRVAIWSAIRHVSMFKMDADEFRRDGPNFFGSKLFAEFTRAMHNDAQKNFHDQVMLVGWGKANKSLLIHSVSIAGDKSHSRDAHGAIGTGRIAATESLVKLNHALHSSLQDSIYMTLAAKFSAESKFVGKDTALFVTRHRIETDETDKPFAIPVQPGIIENFRAIWKRNRNSRSIPLEARKLGFEIAKLTQDQEVINLGSLQLMKAVLEAETKPLTSRKSKRAQ